MKLSILDRYVVKKYIGTFLVMLLLFIPIGILVDLSQKIDNIKENDAPLNEVLWYYFDFVWFFGNMLFPIFLFLSVIWFTSKMAKDTEVIAMLSSGIAFNRYLRPFMIAATIISVFAFIAGMFIVPKTNKRFNEFHYQYLTRTQKDRTTNNLNKQIDEQDFVYVSNYNPNRKMAQNFSYERFQEQQLKFKITARNIRWVASDSIYRLTNYFKRTIEDDQEILESKPRLDTLFSFSIEELSPVTYMSQTLDFFELNEFIESERNSGSPLINNHLLVRHKRWSLPLSAFVLTLIGVSVASFKRRGGMGINLAFGIVMAFTYIFFDKIFEVLVDKSGLSPAVGAWLPFFFFAILALFLLRYAKR